MIIDQVDCTIARRLLVNYRVAPDVVAELLPAPFRPQLVSGWAVGGVCFLALKDVRPPWAPRTLGWSSENVAHRFAVEWDDDLGGHVSVYVPRRDTNSRLASWSGGRLFPGTYGLADFAVQDGDDLRIDVLSSDGSVRLSVRAQRAAAMGGRLFGSAQEAADFFRRGPVGYSPGPGGSFDGVGLVSDDWRAVPVSVTHMASSLFDNVGLFPPGSCALDSALLMRDITAHWARRGRLLPGSPVAVR